jgi:drug/metabolite transporter (DMT)-like permease
VTLRPDVFAVVMATGIVSFAADDHDYQLISAALAAVAAVALAALVVLAVRRWDTRDPDVVLGLFSFVAACAVLASRFRNHPPVLWTLGVVAVVAWLVLAALTARDMGSSGWRAPA